MIAVCLPAPTLAGATTTAAAGDQGGPPRPPRAGTRRPVDVTLHARSGKAALPEHALVAACAARAGRGVLAPAMLGLDRDAPQPAPGAQSTAENTSSAWDLCGAVREHCRKQLEKAAEDGLRAAGGDAEEALSDIASLHALRAWVCACESVIAANSYVSVYTYAVEVRRLMVSLRCNAAAVMRSLSAADAARARSGRLLRGAPRTAALALDDSNRAQFDRAARCVDGWVAAAHAGAGARDLQCPNCFATDNVAFRSRQDRSGDEGMTYYAVCHNCKTVTRI